MVKIMSYFVEFFDVKYYIFGEKMKNDYYLYMVFKFDNYLNIDVLKKVVMQFIKKFLLLFCYFKEMKKGVFW